LSVWPPPKREWVRLTDEEIFELGDEHGWYDDFGRWTFNGAGLIKFVLAIKTAEWVGLTDEDLKPFCEENYIVYGAYTVDFIKAIEAKLKEKNT
jgi:hypothetical protein